MGKFVKDDSMFCVFLALSGCELWMSFLKSVSLVREGTGCIQECLAYLFFHLMGRGCRRGGFLEWNFKFV